MLMNIIVLISRLSNLCILGNNNLFSNYIAAGHKRVNCVNIDLAFVVIYTVLICVIIKL
jgi:hypothetical protein